MKLYLYCFAVVVADMKLLFNCMTSLSYPLHDCLCSAETERLAGKMISLLGQHSGAIISDCKDISVVIIVS